MTDTQTPGRARRAANRPAFDGDRMAQFRTNVALLTQEELAERMGVSASLIYSYEAGRRHPTVPRFRDLIKALSVEGQPACTAADLRPAEVADQVQHPGQWPPPAEQR